MCARPRSFRATVAARAHDAYIIHLWPVLAIRLKIVYIFDNHRRRTQVVRERSAKPLCTGSNPVGASTRQLASHL